MPIGEGRATAEVFAPSWRHFKLCSLPTAEVFAPSWRHLSGIADSDAMPGILASSPDLHRTVPTRTYMYLGSYVVDLELAYPGQMKLQSKYMYMYM